MKKFSFVMAMLAVVLALGLVFSGCGGGDTGTPKTIQGLFDELKDFNDIALIARAQDTEAMIGWCAYHKAWEPFAWGDGDGRTHGGTPAFAFSAARELQAEMNTDRFYDSRAVELRKAVEKLDAFYEPSYKTSEPQEFMDWSWASSRPEGIIWFFCQIRSDGSGNYGHSTTPTKGPFPRDRYRF